MNICIISGSARLNNNTIRVGKALQHLLSKEHQVSLVDFQQYDIPLITQGEVSINNLNTFQEGLVTAMSNAHIVLIISPEYNWSTTPEILNMLHRFGDKSFKHLFDNKIFAMVGVSTGRGGKIPAIHITSIVNKLIGFLNLDSFVSAKIFESHYTKEALTENGESLGNERYDHELAAFMNYTLHMAERWFK
jgi:chromate reductase